MSIFPSAPSPSQRRSREMPQQGCKFCPRCGTYYNEPQASRCTRDETPLHEFDHSHDAGADCLTGRTLADKFILKRRLGAGGMGAVYLAVQKPMGREVAVKVLFPHLTHEPKMVERALREAEAANQVDHPNVVTIYDSGRTQEGLIYIAMEYLEGQDLAHYLVDKGPLLPEEAVSLWLPAVRAMATAHQKGVVHRDLKPDNLFLAQKPGEGREAEHGGPAQTIQVVKVVDFGIAKLRVGHKDNNSAEGLIGTLRYMSPEQMRGQEIGPQSDVYSLGLILCEMLTGKLPWPGEEAGGQHASPVARTELAGSLAQKATGQGEGTQNSPLFMALQRMIHPPAPLRELHPEQGFSPELQQLLDDVLSPEPSQRPPDAGELLRQIGDIPEFSGKTVVSGKISLQAPSSRSSPVCPFPGLLCFGEEQARFFCGRDEEIRQALGKLGATPEGYKRWLQVEGASGAGKSSLARAGLLPAVRHGQIVGAPPFHAVAVFRPGSDPVHNLAQALSRALDRPELPLSADQAEALLLGSEQGLAELLGTYVPGEQGFLLLCDQLEEALMAPGDAPSSLRHFDALLFHALQAPDGPLHLITTIRSDLIGRFGALPRLEEALNEAARYYLRPMQEEGLHQALEEPARLAGLRWEKGLPERIVSEARRAEGGLPLLGYVLRALWQQRIGRLLTRISYEQLGGVGGALTRSADSLLDSLGADGRERARRLFLRLVKIGREGPDTRQAISRSDALAALGGNGAAEELLFRLSGGPDPKAPEGTPPPPRLLIISGGDEPDKQRVDLIHEALLERWQTLREWIAADRKTLERRNDLEAAAQTWEAAGKRTDGLPGGGQLAYYQGEGLPEAQVEWLRTMTSELARRFVNEAIAEERRQELERRRRVQKTVAALCAGVLIMSALSGFAFLERGRARRQQATAEARLTDALDGANEVIFIIDRDLRPIAGTTPVQRKLLRSVSILLDRLLEGAKDDAGVLRSRMISHQQRGDLARTHEDTPKAIAEYQAAVLIAERLLRRDPGNERYLLDLALCHRQLGDLAFDTGGVDDARRNFDRDRELIETLHRAHPDNPDYLLELGRSLRRIGDVDAREGNVRNAGRDFSEGRKHVQALCDKEPHNPEYQYELASIERRLGEALTRSGQFREARTSLEKSVQLAQALHDEQPVHEDYRELLAGAYSKLGELSYAEGSLGEALSEYGRSMNVYQKLLQTDPHSATNQRALASTYRAMGDIAQKMGKLDEAQASYENSLKLRKALLAKDPKNVAYAQGISTLYVALGELQQRAGKIAEARAAVQEALKLRLAKVREAPQDAYSRQRLGGGYISMGDILLLTGDVKGAEENYQQALKLRKELAEGDPNNLRYRQDLGVAYSKLGSALGQHGHIAEAREAHRQALQIHRALVEMYPQNSLYRQDLAQSYSEAGHTVQAAGAPAEAEEDFAEALRLRQALVDTDRDNAEWQRDLMLSHLDLARLPQLRRSVHREHLGAAREILRHLTEDDLLVGDQKLAEAARAVEELRHH